MPTVLLAPDKFKGSLRAPEVADALARGIRAVVPDVDLRSVPVADGGDGTVEAAVAAGFVEVAAVATGPTGRPLTTVWARRGTTAVIEMALVSGLARLPDGPDPLGATSRGTGELIRAAVDAGCRRVVLGIGGSACSDGGAGLMQGLGAQVLDRAGLPVAPGAAGLRDVVTLDRAGSRAALAGVQIVVACDVDNPLLGRDGAAAVYGPQKGASPDDVRILESALARWADVVRDVVGTDHRDEPGSGAAGGVGFAVTALLGARLRPGVDLLLDMLGFHERARGADLVVVGEGSLDAQSLRGKAPVGVAAAARRARVPRVVAVCGRFDAGAVSGAALDRAGIDAVHALTDLEPDPDVCMREAARLLEEMGGVLAAAELA